jgi:hypothetical protein
MYSGHVPRPWVGDPSVYIGHGSVMRRWPWPYGDVARAKKKKSRRNIDARWWIDGVANDTATRLSVTVTLLRCCVTAKRSVVSPVQERSVPFAMRFARNVFARFAVAVCRNAWYRSNALFPLVSDYSFISLFIIIYFFFFFVPRKKKKNPKTYPVLRAACYCDMIARRAAVRNAIVIEYIMIIRFSLVFGVSTSRNR